MGFLDEVFNDVKEWSKKEVSGEWEEEASENNEDLENDDDEDEIEYFVEEEEDNDSGDDSSLFFSHIESEEHEKREGIWKYYDEDFESWDLAQALIDQFPELARHYESDSDETLPKIITETYEIEPQKAFTYLYWLWDTFPYPILRKTKENAFEHETYKSRALLIFSLICENEEEIDEELLIFLCDKRTLHAVFYESLIKKHETIVPTTYMGYLFNRNKYKEMIAVYEAYKEGQEGRISERDLSNVLDNIIVLNLSEKTIPQEIYQFIQKELEKLQPYSKKALKNFMNVKKDLEVSDFVNDEGVNPVVQECDEEWKSKVPIFTVSINRHQFIDLINKVYKCAFSTTKDYITDKDFWRIIRESGFAKYLGNENQKFIILDKGKEYLELGEKNSILITYLGQKYFLSALD